VVRRVIVLGMINKMVAQFMCRGMTV
jgi:hypothetical protein